MFPLINEFDPVSFGDAQLGGFSSRSRRGRANQGGQIHRRAVDLRGEHFGQVRFRRPNPTALLPRAKLGPRYLAA